MGLDYYGRESWLTQDRAQTPKERTEYRWKPETHPPLIACVRTAIILITYWQIITAVYVLKMMSTNWLWCQAIMCDSSNRVPKYRGSSKTVIVGTLKSCAKGRWDNTALHGYLHFLPGLQLHLLMVRVWPLRPSDMLVWPDLRRMKGLHWVIVDFSFHKQRVTKTDLHQSKVVIGSWFVSIQNLCMKRLLTVFIERSNRCKVTTKKHNMSVCTGSVFHNLWLLYLKKQIAAINRYYFILEHPNAWIVVIQMWV